MARIERELRLKQTFKSQKNRRPVEIRQLANLNVEDWRLMVRVNDPEAWQKVKNWWRFGKPVTDAALKKEVEQKKEELKANLRAMDGREYSEAKIDCMDTREVLYTYDRYRLGVDAGVARSRPDTMGGHDPSSWFVCRCDGQSSRVTYLKGSQRNGPRKTYGIPQTR